MIKNYMEKVYAGFLGMNIGIRLGAPLENLLSGLMNEFKKPTGIFTIM